MKIRLKENISYVLLTYPLLSEFKYETVNFVNVK